MSNGTQVLSISESAMKGLVVTVECHITKGLPAIIIIGLGNKAVDEAKERVRGAFSNTKLVLPRKRILLNLAPADVPKEGTSYDVAIAAAILVATGQTNIKSGNDEAFIGELGLDGSVRAIRGIIGKIMVGYKKGIKTFYIPAGNLNQAMLIPNITLIPLLSLKDLYLHLAGTVPIKPRRGGQKYLGANGQSDEKNEDFKHVVAQSRAKRALEIAAAGTHNVLLNGPPGTGKSMLAKALPSILPPMGMREILEVTHLHSLASADYETIISTRPFRAPHHSASNIAIIGGGTHPKPGEISLSHHGVLFFDELPEFNRSTIEALRQPLEDRTISIARAKESITLPANFILVATSNPCPCGYYGTAKTCDCLPHQIISYQRKISGPLLDRIDLYIDVEEVVHNRLLTSPNEEPSSVIAQRVGHARARQKERFGKTSPKTNANLSNQDIKKMAHLSPEAVTLLNTAAERLQISARAYMRCVKVARTIADLENSDSIKTEHIAEALQYRRQPINL